MPKLLLLLTAYLLAFSSLSAQNEAGQFFQALTDAAHWHLTFSAPGTRNWQRHWFLDGLRASVETTPEGMVFSGGPTEGDDACHGVLWTKQTFSGDLKIEFTYTRTDTRTKWVNILYLHATGAGDKPADLAAWQQERIIPAMRTYFNQLNALHLSYAAYHRDNADAANDYVRVRQYPVPADGKFGDTAIAPDYFNTGLFRPGIPYRITVLLTGGKLYFHVAGDGKTQLFNWELPPGYPNAGRIGLRQMYTRSARYGDFRVYGKR